MADPHRPEGEDPSVLPREEPGMPRWVKVSLVIAAAIAILIGVLLLFGGDHGPSRHMAQSDAHDPSVTTQAA
jgi:hypothetical protein